MLRKIIIDDQFATTEIPHEVSSTLNNVERRLVSVDEKSTRLVLLKVKLFAQEHHYQILIFSEDVWSNNSEAVTSILHKSSPILATGANIERRFC